MKAPFSIIAAPLFLLLSLQGFAISALAQDVNGNTGYIIGKKDSTKKDPLHPGDPNRDLVLAKRVIHLVDSISRTSSASGHFAWIYNRVMTNVEEQIKGVDSVATAFIRKFEIAFAGYFLRACTAAEKNDLSSSSEWANLFNNPKAHSLQLTVMGISAHTNGDMWQAFVSNFPEKEIRLHKKVFLACQASIVKVYKPFFDSIAAQSGYLKMMRNLSLGLVKNLGERIIYKWRRRQVNLAILYFHDPERFRKKLAVVQRKKENIDRLLLLKLHLLLPKYDERKVTGGSPESEQGLTTRKSR